MKKYAIIVAGGSGTRMKQSTPKQFLLLRGKPILMHCIEKFLFDDIELILVLNIDAHNEWKSLCAKYNFNVPYTLVKGGNNRFESVKNGLKHVPEQDALVAVHDGVRPLIQRDHIRSTYTLAEEKGNAVLCVPSKDSIRRVYNDDQNTSIPRSEIFLIQTPQVFKTELLKKAYKEEYRNEFTDDATVVERLGVKIHLIEGDYSNIKITVPEDLFFAENYL